MKNEFIKFIRTYYSEDNKDISLHRPLFQEKEKLFLNNCIDSTYVSSVGKYVDTFESEMTKFTHTQGSAAVVNELQLCNWHLD